MYVDVLVKDDVDKFIYYEDKNNYGIGLPHGIPDGYIITQSKYIEDLYRDKGVQVYRLSSLLDLQDVYGLYEVYSHFFEGKVESDFDLIRVVLDGLVNSSSTCYCFKLYSSVCLFTYSTKGIQIVDSIQFSEVLSKYTVGRFMKRLRYMIANAGFNLNSVKYLCWDNDFSDFEDYLIYVTRLKEVFSNVSIFRDMTPKSVIQLLTGNIVSQLSATNFISILGSHKTELGLTFDGVNIFIRADYKADYTRYTNILESGRVFIILDTEGVRGADGKLQNGASSFGGLICRYDGTDLCILDEFSSERSMFNDTLIKLQKNLKSYSRNKIITVYTYGSQDEYLLNNSGIKPSVLAPFVFSDIQPRLNNLMGITQGIRLSKLADMCGVLLKVPQHNALNDAKTLYNIIYHLKDKLDL